MNVRQALLIGILGLVGGALLYREYYRKKALKDYEILASDGLDEEKVIEIKINDVTYIVSEVNRNDDYLKQIIKDMLIEILKYEQKN